MTKTQMQQAFTLEFYNFEPSSAAAKFVARIANYARYVPNTELTNHDAKELARLFDTYIRDQMKAKEN